MNKMILASLALTAILTSCSQGKAPATSGDFQNKIILGAYNDMTSYSTLEESELEDLPRQIDLSKDMTSVKNQSDRGTCTFFSTLAMVEGAIKKDLGLDLNLSEEYLNYATKTSGSLYATEEGSIVTDNVRAMWKSGLMLESDWSYQASWFTKGFPCEKYSSTNSSSPAICFSHNKPNQRATERKIEATGIGAYSLQKNTNAIIRFLAEQKRPLVMSVTVNFNGWPSNGETTHNEELRKECNENPSACGGHSILVTGYDMDKGVFTFKNSWGKEWGKNGYGTIPFKVVDRYTNQDLYYAIANEELELPKGATPEIKLLNFEASSIVNNDKSIDMIMDGNVEETSGKMIYISSYLVKKAQNYSAEAASDGNTELVRIASDDQEVAGNEYVRLNAYNIPQEENVVGFNFNAENKLSFEAKMMTAPSVDEILGSPIFDKFIRSTIYVHTDEDGFKVLKRIYSPL